MPLRRETYKESSRFAAEAAMVDQYTKIVLTIIALALTTLAVRSWLEPAPAVAQGERCGPLTNPCYVTTSPSAALNVKIVNR